jgi:hypothetical protein
MPAQFYDASPGVIQAFTDIVCHNYSGLRAVGRLAKMRDTPWDSSKKRIPC